MGDYFEMDANFPAVPNTPPGLVELLAELKELNQSAKADFEAVRSSERLGEFADKVRQAGAFGAAAQLGKIPELMPEFYPLIDAVRKMSAANENTVLILEKLINKVGG
ncbi:MAG: hypothetical protein IBX55_15960 [Methyloprofundus sp.]|nr:hypothetical protein [Methyloprofundus sp.]